MKKEDIYIKVTHDTIGAYIAVLEKHGEPIGSVEAVSGAFKYLKCSSISGCWFTSRHNNGKSRVNWTPQDLDDFLVKEKYAIEFEKDILATHIHEKTQMTDSVFYNQVVTKSEHEYVVKNADGTASSVTLRDDKAVVEMPNGTLRIVDKSNLFKIV